MRGREMKTKKKILAALQKELFVVMYVFIPSQSYSDMNDEGRG